MKPTCGIITQARLGSTRLPGKVLKELNGKPVLWHHLQRLKWSNLPVFVATTHEEGFEDIVAICKQVDVPYFQGSTTDVLSRFYHCAQQYALDVIVRVTSDCPLVDGCLIADVVGDYLARSDDSLYLSNGLSRTFPRGFDFEVFSMGLLTEAYEQGQQSFEREHVTPYLYRGNHEHITVENVAFERDASAYRITLDTEEDFKLLKVLFNEFACQTKDHKEIISVLESHPYLQTINSSVKQKTLTE